MERAIEEGIDFVGGKKDGMSIPLFFLSGGTRGNGADR